MTADRWWVRLAARWIARVDGVKAHIQMVSLAITAFSTFSIMLQNFGLDRFVPVVGIIGLVLGVAYTYLYAEGGVWNQVQRDRQDLSNNYSGPAMLMDDTTTAVGVFAAVHGRPPTEEEREMIENGVASQWKEYREGIDIEATENGKKKA